jgi:hypothetical protein
MKKGSPHVGEPEFFLTVVSQLSGLVGHREGGAKLVFATIAGPDIGDLAVSQKFRRSGGKKQIAAARAGRPAKNRVCDTGRIAG